MNIRKKQERNIINPSCFYKSCIDKTSRLPVFGNSHSYVKWDYCYSEHDYYSSLPQKGSAKKNYTKFEYK